ncbi:hypothetical protein J7S19_06585 [Corynebacterium pyruviciproducens]|uniref:hypothetical protein n=1 Tax=Corynebacterium pyruviciproducens TaxID=598660 RepID=UPI0024540353|nr:hypothetical protein [Corynebacterium pyruviciproducens]MDH4658275.1 hypothetical protein [Corynebacterium pyruviciproducens]MDK6565858.1 hypothetical protein [Corynebacterium pyruviciproducens]
MWIAVAPERRKDQVDEPLAGVKVYVQYTDYKDRKHGGAVSPAYWTTTNPDGTRTIKIPVKVTFPDGTPRIVNAPIVVESATPENEVYDLQPEAQTVKNGDPADPKASIKDAVVIVTYPDGTTD